MRIQDAVLDYLTEQRQLRSVEGDCRLARRDAQRGLEGDPEARGGRAPDRRRAEARLRAERRQRRALCGERFAVSDDGFPRAARRAPRRDLDEHPF